MISIWIAIFAYPVAVLLNFITLTILNKFGNPIPSGVPLPFNIKEYMVGLFIIAITPGICEEIMFRGTIMRGYENLGKRKSIIYSGLLFGIFHFNVQNLLGPILLGIIFGIIVHKTNSIYSSILGHTVNNGIALTIGFLLTKAQSKFAEVEVVESNLPIEEQFIIMMVIIGIIAIISAILLIYLLKKMPKSEILDEAELQTEDTIYYEIRKTEPIHYWPVLIICAIFVMLNYKYLYM